METKKKQKYLVFICDQNLGHSNPEFSTQSPKNESVDTENTSGNVIFPNNEVKVAENHSKFPECPIKRRKKLHATFLILKKKLNLEKFMRKTQIDSLLKKCKSKIFKTIHEALKKCLSIKLPRLPQNFITNIKIDFNKIYLEKTIFQIYKEHNIISSIEDFTEKGYLLEDKVHIFQDFLNLQLKSVFEYYLNSKQYVNDYYHIQQREGEKFAILFNYISKIFIQYYTKSKGNKPKSRSRYITKENPKREKGKEKEEEYDKDMKNSEEENGKNNITSQNIIALRACGQEFVGSNKIIWKHDPSIDMKPLFKPVRVRKFVLKRKKIKVYEVDCSNSNYTDNQIIFEITKDPNKFHPLGNNM